MFLATYSTILAGGPVPRDESATGPPKWLVRDGCSATIDIGGKFTTIEVWSGYEVGYGGGGEANSWLWWAVGRTRQVALIWLESMIWRNWKERK